MEQNLQLLDGHTTLTGLLGSPVSHSISPLMRSEERRVGKECYS